MIRSLLLIVIGVVALIAPSRAFAADGNEVIHWGNFSKIGSTTDTVSVDYVAKGRAPVNDQWVYVYDPSFYSFLSGPGPFGTDRREEFKNYGFVIVASAGNPGGTFPTQPEWFQVTNFTSSYDAATPLLDISLSYQANWVPTLRGYQSYFIYYNYNQVAESDELVIYDSYRALWPRSISGLKFGEQNFLLTGDGQEANTTFSTWSNESYLGPTAMEIRTTQDAGTGSHWKLMLFANGNAAAFDGIDLTGYRKLVFYAKANRPLTLLGAFGTGDDSGQRSLPAMPLTTTYQRIELDITGLDLSDINTFLWVYLHKSVNPFDFTGVSVFIDNVKLVK